MKYLLLALISILFTSLTIAQSKEEMDQFFTDGKYEESIKIGEKLLDQNTNDYYTSMLIGKAYTNINKYNAAIPYLEKGTVSSNNDESIKAWCFAYLGTCYFALDDYVKAKESLRACVEIGSESESKSSCEIKLSLFQMDAFYDSWEMKETEHFRFHFQNMSNIKDIEKYISDIENKYKEFNTFFNATPFKKIDFFVWDNSKEAKEQLGRSPGFASYGNCIINIEKRQSPGFVLTNILMAYGIKPNKTTQLINEGIAMYFDTEGQDRKAKANKILKGKNIQIAELWENPVNYPKFYITFVGSALIEYLLENGNENQLKKLLKNQDIVSAKNIYLDFDQMLEELETELSKK